VSLVPPTGRIDTSQLAQLSELDSRNLPTIAPRLRASSIPPATVLAPAVVTMPHLLTQRSSAQSSTARGSTARGSTARGGASKSRQGWTGLVRRLASDVRNSKREIALGLVIGIVLSFALGKVGQTYLESRDRASPLTVQSFANEPAPVALRSRVPALQSSGAPPYGLAAAPPAATSAPAATSVGAGTSAASRFSAARPRATRPRATPGPERGTPLGEPRAASEPGDPSLSVPLSPAENAGLGLELPL
jgi:hypothetical protein